MRKISAVPTEPTMLTRATAISTATVQGIAAIRSRMDNNLAPPPAIDRLVAVGFSSYV